ncbi:MAG TPA: hemerythrin domain-containing protein [Acidimicrobiales bacterium]|jgi:hemerythrin superfamily protein|nr:hemerythrin domain-containing protein [Acidimicrobiales bacterium]
MDAIAMLRADHREVERLFKQFEKAGPNAHATRRQIVDKIIQELSVHAVIEEQVFYPAVREAVPDTEDVVLESLEEHHIVKWTLAELEDMDPEHERFVAKATVLMESVRHHVEEEEGELFPQVREVLKRKRLEEVGEAMAKAKEVAPTRPHPRAPDTPPGNLVAGAGAAVVDKAKDAVKKAAKSSSRSRRRKS